MDLIDTILNYTGTAALLLELGFACVITAAVFTSLALDH